MSIGSVAIAILLGVVVLLQVYLVAIHLALRDALDALIELWRDKRG